MFGCKTWWSIKDDTKTQTNTIQTNKSTTYIQQPHNSQNRTPKLSYESEDSSSTYSEDLSSSNHTTKKKREKVMYHAYQSNSSQHNSLDLYHMTCVLERIEKRLNKLEKKKVSEGKSELIVHNRS